MLQDFRRIANLAWPVLLGQLAIIAFGAIDTAMVGRFSALDLAALGLGSSIYISVYVGLTGILVALSPIAAQHFGAQRYREIGEDVRQSGWLAVLLMILGMLALYFPGPLLRIADTPPALTSRAEHYLQILSFGLPASLGFRIYNSLSNAIARPRLVMGIQVVALAVKIPANAWLIFGGFGVAAMGGPGCALASTVINWLTCIAAGSIMARHPAYRPFGIFSRLSRPDGARLAALLKLGIPMGLSYLIEVTAYTFMALFIARFGTTMLAGHQIVGNIGAVLYMTPLSIGIATATLVAQALGAGQPDAARTLSRRGILLAAGVGVLYAAALLAGRAQIIGLYTNNAAVAAAAMSLISIVAAYHICDALQISTIFVLRSYKIAVVPTVIYAVALWGVGLGGGYLVGFDIAGIVPPALTGARGFWIANSVSLGVAACGLLAYRHRIVSRPRRDSADKSFSS